MDVNGSLAEYTRAFPDAFRRDLHSNWIKGKHVLEIGAGNALSLAEFVESRADSLGNLPQIRAVSARIPGPDHGDHNLYKYTRKKVETYLFDPLVDFVHLEGFLGYRTKRGIPTPSSKKLERRLQASAPFDSVVMYKSASTYTHDLTGLWRSIARLTRPGALVHELLYINFTKLMDEQGNALGWIDFYDNLHAFTRVSSLNDAQRGIFTHRRTTEPPDVIPELVLDLDTYTPWHPPSRTFRFIGRTNVTHLD